MKKVRFVKPDSRNRVPLTKATKSLASLYKIYEENGKIILEPVLEIPEEERWLFEPENKEKLEILKRGLSQDGTIDWEIIKKDYSLIK